MVSLEEAQLLEPALQPNVRGGAWYKDDAHLHPNILMKQLEALLLQRGVAIYKHAAVHGFQKNGAE